MKKETSEFSKVFREILQENGVFPRTIVEEADLISITGGQLSRIKNKKSALTNNVIDSIVEKFGKDKESAVKIRERLEIAKNRDSLDLKKKGPVKSLTPVEEFHRDFFQTPEDVTRLICFSYREMPQSINRGQNPEYIETGTDEVKNSPGLSCALFQFFGPLEAIQNKIDEAAAAGDKDARKAWDYIHDVADGIHEMFGRIKEELGNRERKTVLYEALTAPSLENSNLHSRLMYSEELAGKTSRNVRTCQLIFGKSRDAYIEGITETGFQIAVAAQFSSVLDYWRNNNGILPTLESEVETVLKNNNKCPWKIYI